MCKYCELFYCIFYIKMNMLYDVLYDLCESDIIVWFLVWFLWFWCCHCVMPVILTSSLCQISPFHALWLVNSIIGYLFIKWPRMASQIYLSVIFVWYLLILHQILIWMILRISRRWRIDGIIYEPLDRMHA